MHTLCSVFLCFLFLKRFWFMCVWFATWCIYHCSFIILNSDVLDGHLVSSIYCFFFLSLLREFPYLYGQLISLFLSFDCRYPHNNIPPNIIGCIQILTFCLITLLNWIPQSIYLHYVDYGLVVVACRNFSYYLVFHFIWT